MKKYILFIILCLSITSCNNSNKSYNNNSNSDNVSEYTNENKISDNSDYALCNIPWGITNDGFCKLSDKWIKANTHKDGFAYIATMKIKNNGISANYDNKGHLDKVNVVFEDIKIFPQTDYADEEKEMIIKTLKQVNEKINDVIETVSNSYGEPVENDFDNDNTNMYFSNDIITCKWQTNNTNITFTIKNNGIRTTMGCDTKFTLLSERSKNN